MSLPKLLIAVAMFCGIHYVINVHRIKLTHFVVLEFVWSLSCLCFDSFFSLVIDWILQVIGTWDDHDYGLNDTGKEFSGKNISQSLLLDFLDEAEDSPRFEFFHDSIHKLSYV